MANNIKFKFHENIVVIEFDMPDSKVNVLSTPVMEELKNILAQLNERTDVKGVLITSAKPGIFIAGADIKEIEGIQEPRFGTEKSKAGQAILNDLEALSIPSVALINGACLGGGFELALACDYRLSTFSEKVRIGLPEVLLGIIPGFGGTKRLPRLVGLRKGLELILAGKAVSSNDAAKIGIVDGLVAEQRLFEEGVAFFETARGKRKHTAPKTKGLVNVLLEKTPMGRALIISQSRKFVLQTTKGFYPAPLVAIEVISKNYTASLLSALEREARAFGELVVGPVAKNLIKVFYLTEKYKKKKWAEAEPKEVHSCGIVGAGVMGGGIAQLISFHKIGVRIKDLNFAALAGALKTAKKLFDYSIKKRRMKKHDVQFAMGLISPTLTYAGFSRLDVVIEAVVENMKVKQSVFVELSTKVKPDAILASNTSALSIDQMAADAKEPSRVVGMHFFNPVHKMPLIEVIRGARTSDTAVSTIVEFSRKLGKTPIVVKDACGFLINRILVPYLNEAGFMLEEGMRFETIDTIITGFGMPMGPFRLLDEIGLDIGYKVAKILEEGFGERMSVCPVLNTIYEKKLFGKKTKKGFYIYENKKETPNSEIYNLINPKNKRTSSDEDVIMRIVCIMINEAARCLEEDICSEPSDVDIGMIMGTGFPPFRGGLLRYADSLGIETIVAKLQGFQKQLNALRFAPCAYLQRLASKKENFL